jgi:ribosomal protein S13
MKYELSKTVNEAVDQIIEEMPLDERVRISRLSRDELAPLKHALRVYVQDRLEESEINEELKESCKEVVGEELDESGASAVIIDTLWERLKKSHRFRVVE